MVTCPHRSQSFRPGKDFTKNFSVTLKDIDTAVLSHVKNVMKPTIREANEVIKVPVLWANEERWKNVRKNGAIRDKNGSLILPIIMIRRTDVAFNPTMPFSYDQDLKGIASNPIRVSKWSKTNRYPSEKQVLRTINGYEYCKPFLVNEFKEAL